MTAQNMNRDEATVISFKPWPRTETKPMADVFDAFLKIDPEKAQNWPEIRAALTPEWWKKWEESQKPRRPAR